MKVKITAIIETVDWQMKTETDSIKEDMDALLTAEGHSVKEVEVEEIKENENVKSHSN